MFLFSAKDKKRQEAQGFLTKIINNQSSLLQTMREGPRVEQRQNITLPVFIVPVRDGQPDGTAAFATVTKELSSRGVSVVLVDPLDVEQVVIVIRFEKTGRYSFRATLKHQEAIGAGLWQAGFEIDEMLCEADYGVLQSLQF